MPVDQRTLVDARGRRRFLHAVAVAAAATPLLLLSKRAAAQEEGGEHCDGDNDADDKHCRCLLRGTRISTARGLTPIEDLKIGDLIRTEDGRFKPVKWIGRTTFKRAGQTKWHESVLPIRIVQSALDMNLPSRDLFVTPGHCLYIDGYLIPAAYLVNGTSIALSPQESRDVIEYFHIEFEGHEVIYAEGIPVESFHVRDGREEFENYRDYERLYSSANDPMVPYAPVLGHNGVRQNAVALVRSALSQWIDVRDPIQIAYDRITARARLLEMHPPDLASAIDA